jgi:hypothetical protein
MTDNFTLCGARHATHSYLMCWHFAGHDGPHEDAERDSTHVRWPANELREQSA